MTLPKHPFRLLLALGVGAAVVAGVVKYVEMRRFVRGYCFAENRYLTNQEFDDALIAFLIAYRGPEHVREGVPFREYTSVADYRERNPDCCRDPDVRQREDMRDTPWQRLDYPEPEAFWWRISETQPETPSGDTRTDNLLPRRTWENHGIINRYDGGLTACGDVLGMQNIDNREYLLDSSPEGGEDR